VKDRSSVSSVMFNLARLYTDEEAFEEAEPLFLRAIEMKGQILGFEHPSMAIYLNNYAGMCAARQHYVKAEEHYHKALYILEKAHGPDDPDVRSVLGNLIVLYRLMGKEEKALQIEERLGIAPPGNE
jgi:tetratricopeptide (TPR) repeat protein